MTSKDRKHGKTHVYICSAGHSGSTLLDMMLGTHPLCESLGELSLLPMDIAMGNRCGCGTHYDECPLWSPVLEAFSRENGINVWKEPYSLNLGYMAGHNVDRDKVNTLYKLKWKTILAGKFLQHRLSFPLPNALVGKYNEGTLNTLEIYDLVLTATGKQITVDSTKRYSKAVSLYENRPGNTRLVVMVRDGRGVYFSGIKRGFSRRYSLDAWYNYYSRALPNFRRNVASEHIHLMHYEDLVINPEETLRGICGFLKIDYDPAMLDFKSVVHHNVNGNDMKFSSASVLKLDDTWKHRLSKPDYEFFIKKAGSLNRSLGYE